MDLPDAVEEYLKRWADEFRDEGFTEDASGQGVVAYSVRPEEAVRHISMLESRLKGVINGLANLNAL